MESALIRRCPGCDTRTVADPQLVHRQEVVVALDYGQFSLQTADYDPELAVSLSEQAQDADGIAQINGLIVIESPHQNNFEMRLTVELWDRHPANDLDQWQEAFEAHLQVFDQLIYESPTVDRTELNVPPGSYHALITGRGFVAHGWPGSTEPSDEWRIQLWASGETIAPHRVKQWIEEAASSGVPAAGQQLPPKRTFDMADPIRRQLIERLEALVTPVVTDDYASLDINPGSETLDPETIFLVAPSQVRLVLEGPDIESLDPHSYLRRTRESITSFIGELSEALAQPLRQLDALIEDTLVFDAIDRMRAGLPSL